MKYRRGGTSYSSAVGRIRVKERALFNKAYLYSLADAKDADAIIDMLAKTPYAKYVANISGSSDYGKIVRDKWRNVKNLYRSILFDDDINMFLWGMNDLDNVKILLKAKILETEPKDLSEVGNISLDKLKGYIIDDEKINLPKWVTIGIEEAIRRFKASKDPKDISITLDKIYFLHLKKRIKGKSNEFLKDLLKVDIDLYNLETMLRAKERPLDIKELKGLLVEGGGKGKDFYLDLFGSSYEEIINAYENSIYGPFIVEYLKRFAKDRSFYMIEKISDDFKLRFVQQIRHAVFGFEPLIGYVFARRNEAKALEMIFEGKLTGMEPSFIKERIPEVYV